MSASKEITIKYKAEVVLGVSREFTKKHLVITKKENGVLINNYFREDYTNESMYITTSENIESIDIKDKIVYMNFKILLKENEEKRFLVEVGTRENLSNIEITENIDEKLKEVKNFWNDMTSKIIVKTPVESMNIILNGWLLYQTLVSRIWARTAFYQAGGAFRL